jgi:hypothetical protein
VVAAVHDAVAGCDDVDARAVAVDPAEDELQGQAVLAVLVGAGRHARASVKRSPLLVSLACISGSAPMPSTWPDRRGVSASAGSSGKARTSGSTNQR